MALAVALHVSFLLSVIIPLTTGQNPSTDGVSHNSITNLTTASRNNSQ